MTDLRRAVLLLRAAGEEHAADLLAAIEQDPRLRLLLDDDRWTAADGDPLDVMDAAA